MKTPQWVLTLTLFVLLVTINQIFPQSSSLRRYMGGLPWYGWAGIIVVLTLAAIRFALRDAKRARLLLEEPCENHVDANVQRVKELRERLDPNGTDYPHPVIIANNCIGCQRCVDACPHGVLAMVNNLAVPIAEDLCAEDTACQRACPTEACIVINTLKIIPDPPCPPRDIQFMSEEVRGCYIIGEVSGNPLIKIAANEGAEVINHIGEELQNSQGDSNADFDVAIIGIGPAGLWAAITAKQKKLKYVAIEQGKVLSTIDGYSKGKDVLFKPETMAALPQIIIPEKATREGILELWLDTMKANAVVINEQECCKAVTRADDGDHFIIETEKVETREQRTYRARRVVLALGNRGAPRKLGPRGAALPGESKDRVKYSLSNHADFERKKVLVVGGGNSAVEAAVALVARSDGAKVEFHPQDKTCEVTLVVRSGFTNDIKFVNKQKLYTCIDAEKIKPYWDTGVKAICDGEVVLMDPNTEAVKATVANDYILALIGAEPPAKFLKAIGITIPES
jgi:thioredoxin reductase/NAD-dependent dihydropyrimidine dehydrogenase PreA subunit